MAHSRTARKRIRQNLRRRARNRWRKDRFRTAIKEYRETLLHGSVEAAEQQLRGLYRLLDQVASTGTLHRNTASRYKARLTVRLNSKKKSASATAS